MSAEISEIENSKDEIYQLIFVAVKFTWLLNNIVISSFKRRQTYWESITNDTINNMSMDDMLLDRRAMQHRHTAPGSFNFQQLLDNNWSHLEIMALVQYAAHNNNQFDVLTLQQDTTLCGRHTNPNECKAKLDQIMSYMENVQNQSKGSSISAGGYKTRSSGRRGKSIDSDGEEYDGDGDDNDDSLWGGQRKSSRLASSEGQRFQKAMKNMKSYLDTILDTFNKYHQKLNTKQIQSVNTTKKDAKKALKCLIFGYIKQETENKYNLIIPFYLKMICLQFYGYIIMKSNILNINQINTIQYVLTENLSHKQFYFKKICDSKTDGFNAKKFNLKYNKCENSLIIIKT
eukprot:533755_1